jgi:hypothetical protein
MLPARFEPAIPTGERPQTQALDRAATRIGFPSFTIYYWLIQRCIIGTTDRVLGKTWPRLTAAAVSPENTPFHDTEEFIRLKYHMPLYNTEPQKS